MPVSLPGEIWMSVADRNSYPTSNEWSPFKWMNEWMLSQLDLGHYKHYPDRKKITFWGEIFLHLQTIKIQLDSLSASFKRAYPLNSSLWTRIALKKYLRVCRISVPLTWTLQMPKSNWEGCLCIYFWCFIGKWLHVLVLGVFMPSSVLARWEKAQW